MQHLPRLLVAAILALPASGCVFGIGAMAPGVDEWVFATSYTKTRHIDSVGHIWDTWSVDSTDAVKLDWGLSAGGRMGIGFVSLAGAERTGAGLASGFEAQARTCMGVPVCFGLDAGYLSLASDFKNAATGTFSAAVKGWSVVPQVQVGVLGPVWIDGGYGGAKVQVGTNDGGGGSDRMAPAAWHPHWNLGLGFAFNASFGVRLAYSRTYASGVVDGQTLDAVGSAWTLQFLID